MGVRVKLGFEAEPVWWVDWLCHILLILLLSLLAVCSVNICMADAMGLTAIIVAGWRKNSCPEVLSGEDLSVRQSIFSRWQTPLFVWPSWVRDIYRNPAFDVDPSSLSALRTPIFCRWEFCLYLFKEPPALFVSSCYLFILKELITPSEWCKLHAVYFWRFDFKACGCHAWGCIDRAEIYRKEHNDTE